MAAVSAGEQVKAQTPFAFVDAAITDDGVLLHFVCADPGAGLASDYYALVSDADVAAIATADDFDALVGQALGRKLRGAGLVSHLAPYVGRSVKL